MWCALLLPARMISIHALREEGDANMSGGEGRGKDFYPRPPRGGRPGPPEELGRCTISIHALREEGDGLGRGREASSCGISIHALREEGDGAGPAPGERMSISIHALREEGDCPALQRGFYFSYFYPRPT